MVRWREGERQEGEGERVKSERERTEEEGRLNVFLDTRELCVPLLFNWKI
jgi:hypothetical protein